MGLRAGFFPSGTLSHNSQSDKRFSGTIRFSLRVVEGFQKLLELATILTDEGSGNAVLVNELPVDRHDISHLEPEWEGPGSRIVISANILGDVGSSGLLLFLARII